MKDIFASRMHKKSTLEELDMTHERIQHAWEDPNIKRNSCLKSIMRPLLIFMSLSGCYNFCDIYEIATEDQHKLTIKRILSNLYRLGVLVVLLLMLAKFVVAFFYLPSDYYQLNGLCTVWSFSLLTNFLVYLKSSRYGQYEAAVKFWEDKIIPEMMHMNMPCPIKRIKRRCLITVIIAFICIAINIAGVGVQIKINTGYFYVAPFPDTPLTVTVYITFMFIVSLVWLFPQANAIVTSRMLTHVFQTFNKHLSDTIQQQSNIFPQNLQKLRLLHMNICKLVSDLDQDFCWFFGTSFAFSIGLSVFTLYQIMKTEYDTISLVLYMFWFSCGLLIIGFTSTFAAFVHDEAHAALDTIYYINVQDITVEKLAQLNLFLSKLTGTQVGFTTCGLLTITKEFILTIAGVFLTYFAVLYTL